MNIIIHDWQKEYFKDNQTPTEMLLFAYLCMLNKDVVEISYNDIKQEALIGVYSIKYSLKILQAKNLIKQIGRGKYQILINKNNNIHESKNEQIERLKNNLSDDSLGRISTLETMQKVEYQPLKVEKQPLESEKGRKTTFEGRISTLEPQVRENINLSDEKIDNPLVYKHKYNNSLNINTSNNITSKEDNISSNICLNKKENTPYFLEKENIYKEKDTFFPNKENKSPLYEVLFNEFWEAYPRAKNRTIRTNKDKCLNKYRHFTHLKETHKAIMATLEYLKTTQQWTKDDGDFIPMTYTFLNSKIWEQEDIIEAIKNINEEKLEEERQRQEDRKLIEKTKERIDKNNRYFTYANLCKMGITKETADRKYKNLFDEFDPTKEQRRKRLENNELYGLDTLCVWALKAEFGIDEEEQNPKKPSPQIEGFKKVSDGIQLEVINTYDKNNTRK